MVGQIAISAALACALLFGVPDGCGLAAHRTETTEPENPAKALTRWYGGVEEEVAKKEEEQSDYTHFPIPGEAPGKSGLLRISASGVGAGEMAADAASQLSEVTNLTRAEAAGLYCYFFAYYVDLGSLPDKNFGQTIYNLVLPELDTSASLSDVSESADALRRAMIRTERTGTMAPKVAAGIFC